MDDPSHPLKPEHCGVCNNILAEGMRNAAVIAKCKACGLPVEDSEAHQQQIIEMVGKIKANFFPNNL